MAFSIESNNERPLPHTKGWVAATCFYESVSNNFSCLTFVLTKRGLSNRFISNFSREGHFYFQLVCTIISDAYTYTNVYTLFLNEDFYFSIFNTSITLLRSSQSTGMTTEVH